MRILLIFVILVISISSHSQEVPLGMIDVLTHLNQEISGESAKRNLEYITRLHRMRGSKDYDEAIGFIKKQLSAYRVQNIETIAIPTDGKTFYGTQLSRPAWNVKFAELWEVEKNGANYSHVEKIADWESVPLTLAQDSHSGHVTAELVDIGRGTTEEHYKDVDVKGKLVLTSSQPLAVVPLAIEKYGAVGILSYAQNQVTAWWKENENLIRWGHLDFYSPTKTFAFMVSLKQAREFQRRLYENEKIILEAKVDASAEDGFYNILTATIPGSDPDVKDEEIMYTCHLDHPRPGANDNASGTVTILEIARAMNKLITEGKIEAPKRTIRFVWSPEIEGTTALLNFRPDIARKTKFNIHLDMVGGGPTTKAIFHISKSPASVPTFMNGVAEAFGELINETSNLHSSGRQTSLPMVSREGGREALHAILDEFHMGSDFQVFAEGSWRIPTVYLHDWPDRYIHTTMDIPANIDPTKLKRSVCIGLSTGYFVSQLDESDVPELTSLLQRQMLRRLKKTLDYCKTLPEQESENVLYHYWKYEMDVLASMEPYAKVSLKQKEDYYASISKLQELAGAGKPISFDGVDGQKVYKRNADVKGPMSVFGYNYFDAHYDKKKPRPKVFKHRGKRGAGYEYAYEILNFVDGKKSAAEIRNAVSAEFGPIPLEYVEEYLDALSSIGIVKASKSSSIRP